MTTAKDLYKNIFGNDDKIKITYAKGQGSLKLKRKQIINPAPSDYIFIKKIVKMYSENRPDIKCGMGNEEEMIFWTNLMHICAIMELSISDSKLERWQGKYPILNYLD